MKPNIFVFIIALLFAIGIGLCLNYYKANNLTEKNPSKNDISNILQLGYENLTEDEADFYAMMFSKYAKKYEIDWRIYPAIITIESNWDPSAVSHMGAKGTMQMLDSTLKMECQRVDIVYKEKRTSQNDVILLGRGLEYLSRMVKSKGMERGVKGYIGGPRYSETNVDCKEYWIKFNAEYSKVLTLSKDYKRMEAFILNKALSN